MGVLPPGIVVEPMFSAFATAAFFEFALFAVFEMRYLLHIWRSRRASALDAWGAQRELSWLYGGFYFCLLGGVFVTYQLQRCAIDPALGDDVEDLHKTCGQARCLIWASGMSP